MIPEREEPASREALVEHLLVLRAQVGDREALGRLHAAYDRRLAGYLTGLLPSSADADDVLQEVWIRVLRKIASLEEPGAFRGWLFSIARNQATSRLRRRRDLSLVDLPDEGSQLPAETTSDAELWAESDAALLRRRLESLPPAHREVLVLRYFEHLSYDEIAAVVGRSIGTVRSRLHYAKKALRAAEPPPT